ncbi:MAG: dipeptide epimerase [Planctomycetes bacterium]|nr:dipeptide epimerase [Planctomycetota bacterium]
MKIVALESRRVRLPLTRAYAIHGGSWDCVDLMLCELVADDGQRGFGQASPAEEVTGESIEACASALAPERTAWLLGREVSDFGALVGEVQARGGPPAARAALDMALFDLEMKRCNVPLVEQLARSITDMATSVTIGLKGLDETLAEAQEYIGRGFRALKVKTGASVDLDLERLGKLRERYGDGIALRADANQGYDLRALKFFATRMEALDLEMLEQPTARGEEDAWRALPEHLRRRVAADESVHDEGDLQRFVKDGAPFGIVNIKLMKCGGLRPALRMARIAERAKLEVMWGCMDESVLGIAAALHAAFASPATRYLDLDGSLDLGEDPFTGGFALDNGRMRTLALPGLGVQCANSPAREAAPPRA